MSEQIIYDVHIRVVDRLLLPDPQVLADALARGGFPVTGVVVQSGATQDDYALEVEGQDEQEARTRRWVREKFAEIDAGTVGRAVGAKPSGTR